MSLIEQVKDRLSIFKNLYDVIRIIDPVNKKVLEVDGYKDEIRERLCYHLWGRDEFCENCVSMRSYLENDTFVKLQHKENKVCLLTATSIVINNNLYIVEILKDISDKGEIKDRNIGDSHSAEKIISEINDKIIRDELTGIYNRRFINERLPVDINNSNIKEQALSVIMTDIDSFKRINDQYGYIIGNRTLVDFTRLLKSCIRESSDWLARYEGEEFLIVLNNTDCERAYKVAERIRRLLENTKFIYDDISINITSSFGIYSLKDREEDAETLISNADKCLYEAKRLGRNTTFCVYKKYDN
jgi:two-component system, cell cycle response regulator